MVKISPLIAGELLTQHLCQGVLPYVAHAACGVTSHRASDTQKHAYDAMLGLKSFLKDFLAFHSFFQKMKSQRLKEMQSKIRGRPSIVLEQFASQTMRRNIFLGCVGFLAAVLQVATEKNCFIIYCCHILPVWYPVLIIHQ